MKVLALNGSPKIKNSNTSVILNPFLDGMKEAGADVELVHAKELDISPCLGCSICIFKTPGQCVQKDDMGDLFLKLFTANVVVWATPVYFTGPTAQLKTIVDRTFVGAGFNPGYEIRNGHQQVKLVDGFSPSKLVLVSSSGLHEMDNFDTLLNWVDSLVKLDLFDFAGALLRPHANVLSPMFAKEFDIDDIIQAAKDAGRQLILEGKMSDKTLSIVSRDILTRDEYIKNANQFIQEEIEKNTA
jgi:multimeric flavodoxin WrbA